MKLEYFNYYVIPVKSKFSPGNKNKNISIKEIKSQLEKSIVNKLLSSPNAYNDNYICVETKDADVIREFDEKWLKKGILGKNKEIEVTQDQIDDFDYFFTDLESFDWGDKVFYDIERPTCSHETCLSGFNITSQVEISDKIVGTFDIARAYSIWDSVVKLILSARAKELFDREAFTGLKYTTSTIF